MALRSTAVCGSDAEVRAAFAQVYREIEKRLEIFVNLPLDSLDEPALQERLRALGDGESGDV